jgi:SagB-type dehydrogenase family enzyme
MTAQEYHQRTKHSYESVRRVAHYLDWENHPLLFKIYPDLEPIPLPREFDSSRVEALAAIGGMRREHAEHWSREAMAHLLYFAAGTKGKRFRMAACTGALYEIELYVVCGQLEDLAAGVYHFSPGDLALRRLREGDWRAALRPLPPAPAYVVSTGTYWRNAWKYQARTYRHFGWDNGTILANLVTVAGALGWRARVVVGFVDREVNRLLGLDTDKEVALSVTALGEAEGLPPASGKPEELHLAAVPLSREERDYPLMRAMHAATELHSAEEVWVWRSRLRK